MSSHKAVSDICEAFISPNAFTGCDSVSAFAGKGKIRHLKTMYSYESYLDKFQQLGSSWLVNEDFLLSMEKFVCHMYGYKQPNLVNDVMYKMHCSKNGKITADLLPPCKDALHQHILRVNYQTRVLRL